MGPTAAVILGAILSLAPQLPASTAERYAVLIDREARRYDVDGLLVVAVIDRETGGSWNPKALSKTNDFGLLQLHVSSTTHPGYLFRPERLYNPRVNIRLGARLLRLWKSYHAGHCGQRAEHPWWSHYQWGKRVRNPASGLRVGKVYSALVKKFRGQPGEV
jgi:soluble lytic murein transglycosylase-like protein